MQRIKLKRRRRSRRKAGIRKRVMGVASRPRLSVFRSVKHLYAQIIDDLAGKTLVAASTLDKHGKLDPGGNCEAAATVGRSLAKRAQDAGIRSVVFDRGGYRYHGRIKALAEAARKGGLEF